MILYYLKTAIKSIWNNKRFSAINIIGFAFGISICMAISLFLIKEYSYDRYHENADQIVRLTDTKNNSSSIDYRIKDVLQNRYSEIENACIVQRVDRPVEIQSENKGFYLDDIMSVDNNFFDVFSIPFVSGNSLNPLANINSAITTESTSRKLFGTANPIGKEILVDGRTVVTITGVIKDFPENSSITAALLVNAENENFKFSKWIGNSNDLSTYRWPFRVYLQLNKNVEPNTLLSKINAQPEWLKPYGEEVGFLKLKDIYLHDTTTGSSSKRGNAGLLRLLTIVAAIILALAVINYINLSVAQQNKRNKVTGIKKTIGATRGNILIHFLFESILVTALAFVVGIILVWLGLPVYQSVFNTQLSINALFQFPNFIYLIGFVFLIGAVSGCGPSLTLSGVNPVHILSGSTAVSGKRNYVRSSLTVFQFATSIILIFSVIIVVRQIQYVKHKNPGFAEEQLLRLDIPDIQEKDISKALALIDELHKSPYLGGISVTNGVPGRIRMSMGTNMENTDKNTSIKCLMADTTFLETFDINVIKGRNLQPGDYGNVCMINEAAYKYFEFDNLENKRINNYNPNGFEIIGVINDFQFNSLHSAIEPICIMFTPRYMPTTINIRLAENGVTAGMDFIQKTWQDVLPGYPVNYEFYDAWFDSMYRAEERFAQSIGLFALLAIVISCIGIWGLAIFSSERRTKEIGVRKVNGARISEVMTMLNKDYIRWVAVGFIIATPIAWYTMNKWLESFAYKTTLSWWIFALAGLLALGIALLTVSFQSWKAATKNPVESLRYE
ncbi:ABC transporter permease [Sunxiuqinia sp. A32]|uniref:ABC transporter permease n=1 Tax=Sunxiuqinia sp. A32 TaxID=3461496 RepID=UPI00404648B3